MISPKLKTKNLRRGFTLIKTSLRENFVSINQGFTLIELLVVIMIIGVLVGISLFALVGARESARDGRRKADLETIRSALELYKSDCDAYPTGSGNVTAILGSTFTGGACNSNTYLDNVPNDPVSGRRYYYSSSGTTYELCAALEDPPTSPDSCTGGGTNCGVSCNYQTTNP